MGLPKYDETHWPVLLVRPPRDGMNEDELRRYGELMNGYFARGDRFVSVVDVRGCPPLSAKQRATIAGYMRRGMAEHPGRLLGSAIVMDSALQRGLLTALQWLARPEYPVEMVATVGEGMRWAAETLRAARRA